MDIRQAEDILQDHELIELATGSIHYIKELVGKCLDANIPATVGQVACASKSCSPRAALLVRDSDITAITTLMQREWIDMVAAEGTAQQMWMGGAGPATGHPPNTIDKTASETDEPPCPACGTAAPLVEGACSDCGIQLM